jgi:uncharacterized protein YkwD
VAHRRYAILAWLCALVACACLPASAALGARRARVDSFHRAHKHGARTHRVRCTTTGAHRRSGRRHARHSSFHTGVRPRCHRRHGGHGRRGHPRHRGATHRLRRAPAANSSACLDAELVPSQYNVPRVRAATMCLINRERAGHGESPLTDDAHMASAAQAHTEDMAFGDYFGHVGPRGDTPLSRMRSSGYIYSSKVGYEIGENIAWGTLWLGTPRAIVAAWMGSPEHRANILDARYRDTGIGVSAHPPGSMAHGQPGGIYTQDFGVIVAG